MRLQASASSCALLLLSAPCPTCCSRLATGAVLTTTISSGGWYIRACWSTQDLVSDRVLIGAVAALSVLSLGLCALLPGVQLGKAARCVRLLLQVQVSALEKHATLRFGAHAGSACC